MFNSARNILIEYPQSWELPPNPQSAQVAQNTERWLRQIGVVRDARSERSLRAMAVGCFGGAPFPLAPRGALEIIMRFLSLGIFYDDLIEGSGERAEEVLIDAVRGLPRGVRPTDPCQRGWWELGRRCQAQMSERWMTRHAERYAAWLRSVRAEAKVVARFRGTGEPPTMREYLSLREMTTGVYPTIDLIELSTGRELPAALLDSAARAMLERLACHIVILQNDLVAFSKDRADTWPNAVTCAARDCGVGISDAFAVVAEHHNALVDSFVQLEPLVMRDAPWSAHAWICALHHMIGGFAWWHMQAPRYRTTHELGDGRAVRIELKYGLGQVAAQAA